MAEDIIEWPDWNKKRIGQLIMCNGGTCGEADKGAIEVPISDLKDFVKSNGFKKYFKITESPCLGVCKPHNVSLMLTPNEQIWLGMFRSEAPYKLIKLWIKESVEAGTMIPIPQELKKYRFDRFPRDA